MAFHRREHDSLLFSPSPVAPHLTSASPQFVNQIPRKPVKSTDYELAPLETPSESKVEKLKSLSTSTRSFHKRLSPSSSAPTPPAENAPSAPTRPQSSFRWWSLEIICLLGALGCLGAMVGVLRMYDGKSQERWSNSTLTLNGLIALLSTLCRTFFMVAVASTIAQGKWIDLSERRGDSGSQLGDFALFDHASRGLWGSAQLLWRYKGA